MLCSSWVTHVDFLKWAKNALAYSTTNLVVKKEPCWNREVNVGNKSWVHCPMASNFHLHNIYLWRVQIRIQEPAHIFSTTIGSLFMHFYNEKAVLLSYLSPLAMM